MEQEQNSNSGKLILQTPHKNSEYGSQNHSFSICWDEKNSDRSFLIVVLIE